MVSSIIRAVSLQKLISHHRQFAVLYQLCLPSTYAASALGVRRTTLSDARRLQPRGGWPIAFF
jgi:hypothetical protein